MKINTKQYETVSGQYSPLNKVRGLIDTPVKYSSCREKSGETEAEGRKEGGMERESENARLLCTIHTSIGRRPSRARETVVVANETSIAF